MASSDRPGRSPWSGLSDRGQVALLERLRARLDEAFPGGVEPGVDARRRVGTLRLSGTGKRRLSGMRRDLRRHELRAATDGRFLTAAFEVDGALVDTLTAAAPSASDVDEVVAFFARHEPRIWWKGPRPLPSEAPAKRSGARGGPAEAPKEPTGGRTKPPGAPPKGARPTASASERKPKRSPRRR